MPDTSAEQGVVAEQTIVSQSTLTMRVIIGRPHVMFPGSLEPVRIYAVRRSLIVVVTSKPERFTSQPHLLCALTLALHREIMNLQPEKAASVLSLMAK
jgi:hypothetical protein